jgi:hypothetical protein
MGRLEQGQPMSEKTTDTAVRFGSIGLVVLWIVLIALDWRMGHLAWLPYVLMFAFVLTWVGLYRLHVLHLTVPSPVKWIGIGLFAWLLFVSWGLALSHIDLLGVASWSSDHVPAVMLANSVLTAVIVAALLAFPLVAVYRSHAWWIAAVVWLPILVFQAPDLIDPGVRPLVRTLMVTELLSLALVLSLLSWTLSLVLPFRRARALP